MSKQKELVKHKKFQEFQQQYGYIPAGDKNNHILKSRMLQGVYRNNKIENDYCNYIEKDDNLVNFMGNNKLKEDAHQELSEIQKRNRLTSEDRLLSNLLSSQPLAFNIFLPLRWDNYKVVTSTFQKLFPSLNISIITGIKLEYVPGDENKKRTITQDSSCFDVYVEYRSNANEKCGIGIEVKYTEPFSQTDFRKADGEKKERYIRAIKKYNHQFSEIYTDSYLSPKFNQLFRNQLLTLEVTDKVKEIKNCVLAVLYSNADKKCIKAIDEFKGLLKMDQSYFPVTIENLLEIIIESSQNNSEIKNLFLNIYNRYCNYSLLDEYFS